MVRSQPLVEAIRVCYESVQNREDDDCCCRPVRAEVLRGSLLHLSVSLVQSSIHDSALSISDFWQRTVIMILFHLSSPHKTALLLPSFPAQVIPPLIPLTLALVSLLTTLDVSQEEEGDGKQI